MKIMKYFMQNINIELTLALGKKQVGWIEPDDISVATLDSSLKSQKEFTSGDESKFDLAKQKYIKSYEMQRMVSLLQNLYGSRNVTHLCSRLFPKILPKIFLFFVWKLGILKSKLF